MTRARTAMIWLGGGALVAATAIDTLAVVGRQVGLPLRGSIELVQAAVLVVGSIALIAATLADRHAQVHLILDRLPTATRTAVERALDLLSASFVLCVLIGSAWLAFDLWSAHELSEIVGVPWRWLRLFANVSLALVLALMLRRAFAGERA